MDQARPLKVDLELGGHREVTFENADLVVVSPGVPHTLPVLERVRQRGIQVIGELDEQLHQLEQHEVEGAST